MNYRTLVSQAVRARRGARTQTRLSKSLGYKSNVIFSWENGHDDPSARSFFHLLDKTGGPPDLSHFLRVPLGHALTTRPGITEFLRQLLGHRKLTDAARSLEVDRHAVGRWVRGQTDIPMADLLHFVDWASLSLFDFLHTFVDPLELPEAEDQYRTLLAARDAAKSMPWAHAIVHMVDLPSYRSLPRHEPGWFASRLAISIKEESRCLQHLVESGQLAVENGRYSATSKLTVDTQKDPGATRQLASFWMKEASNRVLTPGRGRFAFNTFAVSRADLEEARELQSEYFQRLRALVADSEPTEAVAVATFSFMPLSVETPPPPPTPCSPEAPAKRGGS